MDCAIDFLCMRRSIQEQTRLKKTIVYIYFFHYLWFHLPAVGVNITLFSYAVGLVSMLQTYGLDWAVQIPNIHKYLSLYISVQYVCFSCPVHHQSWLAHLWIRATYQREGICLFVCLCWRLGEGLRWITLQDCHVLIWAQHNTAVKPNTTPSRKL